LDSDIKIFGHDNQQGMVNKSVVMSALATTETLLADDWCLVPAEERDDAGYYGISAATCLSKAGTCFDTSDPDATNCYFTKHHEDLENILPMSVDAHAIALAAVSNVTNILMGVQLRTFFHRTFRMLDENADGLVSLEEANHIKVDQLAGPPRDIFIKMFSVVLVASIKRNVVIDGTEDG